MTSNADHPRRWALIAVAMGVFCIELDSFALNLALSRIGPDLQAAAGGPQWVVSAYLLAVGTLMLGAGRAADRYGRRRLLIIGLCLFGTTSLLCAVAPSLPFLVAARAFQGAGGALIMPAGLALVTHVFPADLRGRATGLALGCGAFAMVCGPFVGGLLTGWLSWRAVFWLNAPIAVLAIRYAWRAPEPGPLNRTKLDGPGLVMITAALAALVLVVYRGADWGWVASGALLTLFLALTGLFVAHEREIPNPLIALSLFRNIPYVVFTTAGSLANAATVVFLLVVPISSQDIWGLSPGEAGVAFLGPTALMALAAPAAGRVSVPRAAPVMSASLVVAAAGLCSAALVTSFRAYLLCTIACGAGLGTAKALTLIATQAVIPSERAGEASGVTKAAITVPAGLAAALTGPVTDGATVARAAPTALGAAAVACLVAWALLVAVRSRASDVPHRSALG